MKHVFISYSRKDSEFVERLERDLNDKGVDTWRDKTSIKPGDQDWHDRLVEGLENTFAVIAIVTEAMDQSRWVKREQLFADEANIPIIPVQPEPHQSRCLWLKEKQSIVLNDDNYDSGLDDIIYALDAAQNSPTTSRSSGDAQLKRPKQELDYLKIVLSEARADKRDALYVNLLAISERPTMPKYSLSDDLDIEFSFERLDLEIVHGDEFGKSGESVPDARTAIRGSSRTVLLGNPGSGKTSTLRQLLVDLARAAEKDPSEKLPVYVPLREFKGLGTFESFLRSQMNILQSDYDRLLKNNRLLILCDALNEMPRHAADKRDLVVEVREYLRDKPTWVVSCRMRDYQEDLKELNGLRKVRLKPLDLPRIKQFIQHRFHIDPAKGDALWKEIYGTEGLLILWRLLEKQGNSSQFWDMTPRDWHFTEGGDWRAMRNDPRKMMSLCRNPYLLTIVCALYEQSGKLLNNRGGLFATFVDITLERERQICIQRDTKWIPDKVIRQGLAQIAFAMQSGTEMLYDKASVLIREKIHYDDPALLLRLANAANLVEIGDSVRFTHQLLQEYFASELLGSIMDATPDGANNVWSLENWWEANGYEETAIILAGVRNDPEAVARWLVPAQPDLAWQVLTESGVTVDTTNLKPETRTRFLKVAEHWIKEVKPINRAAGYRILGYLNADERPGIGVKGDMPDIAWCDPISAGSFLYGYEKKTEHIDYAYTIAKYPITNAQFQVFIDAEDGYNQREWWTEAGWVWKRDLRTPIGGESARFRLPNHPRISVSWYEAVAFCNWLTSRLYPEVWIDVKKVWLKKPLYEIKGLIRLPTEQEWERAARGIDGREYPWGNTFDAERCNSLKSDPAINMTSAVGIFQNGVSPCGALDMVGNVWEWSLTQFGNESTEGETVIYGQTMGWLVEH